MSNISYKSLRNLTKMPIHSNKIREIIVLLGGGDKSTQRQDIERARELKDEYEKQI